MKKRKPEEISKSNPVSGRKLVISAMAYWKWRNEEMKAWNYRNEGKAKKIRSYGVWRNTFWRLTSSAKGPSSKPASAGESLSESGISAAVEMKKLKKRSWYSKTWKLQWLWKLKAKYYWLKRSYQLMAKWPGLSKISAWLGENTEEAGWWSIMAEGDEPTKWLRQTWSGLWSYSWSVNPAWSYYIVEVTKIK